MKLSEEFSYRCSIPLRWSDADEMGHINNATYLTYLEEARIQYMQEVMNWNWLETGLILARCEIDFKKPLFATDILTVYLRTIRIGNTSFDFEYVLLNNKDEVVAQAKTVKVVYDYQAHQPAPIPEKIRSKLEAELKRSSPGS